MTKGIINRQPEPHKGFFCDGVYVMQSINITESYPVLFGAENFSRCVELGTAFGGLSIFIRNYLNFDGDIITYDIADKPSDHNPWVTGKSYVDARTGRQVPSAAAEFRVPRTVDTIVPPEGVNKVLSDCDIDFRVNDCFRWETRTEIADLISSEGKTLLICDGGDKAKEISVFSEFLKPGDIVLGHDYFKDGVTNPNIWPVCELNFSMVQNVVLKYNLKSDNQYTELFTNSITFIAIKEK